ncbi:glycosyltransferase family 87 protein [Sediminibacterium ginsengisoli]|uniref:Alpha-1,2-mannosyltransferase n=1 Tax=Sediminibacterium ginsengisoli TaxID=413434 RepID=A0A1T4NZ26_9BACT|nr:glycosyltransferase family 87 protein [Sediminibacterium ginsengisoli]SJZ84352.1 Protein of unknown function [Sediminibacterium ginsengisoli]
MRVLYKYWLVILFALVSVMFLFLSINQAYQENEKGDYYIYWITGQKFLSGERIYEFGKEDGTFIYPPFAAMFFSLFAAKPFHISAVYYSYLINFGLWVLSLWLIWKILKNRFPFTNIVLPFIIGVLCSARYYWHNFIWMQANLPVLCATLGGIYYHFKGNRNASYFLLLAGAFFKVTPILILGFLLLKGRLKDWWRVVVLSMPFLLLPFAARGPATGLQDWIDYYHSFLTPFASGKVDGDLISLGLPSFLDKLNVGNEGLGIQALSFANETSLKTIILLVNLAVLLLVTLKIFWDGWELPLCGTDFCMLLLLILLLPGRVWEHHHLTLGFIIAYLMAGLHTLKKTRKWIWFALPLLITGLIGTDTIGAKLYDYTQQFSLITLIVLYLLILLFCFGKKSESESFYRRIRFLCAKHII